MIYSTGFLTKVHTKGASIVAKISWYSRNI